jgi:hypothetical protein
VEVWPSGYMRPSRAQGDCTSVATMVQDNFGTQNRRNADQKQQNTSDTRQESSGQGQKKEKNKKTRGLDPKCSKINFRGASEVPSTTIVTLEASRAASERSPRCSWDLPGRPRERLGELSGASWGAPGASLGACWTPE